MSEMTDYDVLVYVDGSTESSAISKVVDDNQYYVPKIKGTAISGPVVPPKPQSTHFLTIMDSTFYKGVDSHMIFKGTVCADTSKFKIIINLPTGLIVSGGEIVRGFVVYETGKTHDNFMKINGTSWELKIPTTNDAFNLTFNSMLACPVCYLTAITTNSDDETYGDEAIFNWLVLPPSPTIAAKGDEYNEVVLTSSDAAVEFIVHAPSAIPGDIVEISNITNPEFITTTTIVVEEKHVDYNSVYLKPTYTSSKNNFINTNYVRWDQDEQQWTGTEWKEPFETPKYSKGGMGYGAKIPFNEIREPNIKLKATLSRNDGIQTYKTGSMNRWFVPKTINFSDINTSTIKPSMLTVDFPINLPRDQWTQLRNVKTQEFVDLYAVAHSSADDSIAVPVDDACFNEAVGDYFLVGINQFMYTTTSAKIQNYIDKGYDPKYFMLDDSSANSVMLIMKYDSSSSSYIRVSDFYSVDRIVADYINSRIYPFKANNIDYFGIHKCYYDYNVYKRQNVFNTYKITEVDGKAILTLVSTLKLPDYSTLFSRNHMDFANYNSKITENITVSSTGTLLYFPPVLVDQERMVEVITFKFNPDSERFYVLNTGQELQTGEYNFNYDTQVYDSSTDTYQEVTVPLTKINIKPMSYNVFNDILTVVCHVSSSDSYVPYRHNYTHGLDPGLLTNNIFIKEYKFINNMWVDQEADAISSNYDYKYMQLSGDMIVISDENHTTVSDKTLVVKGQKLSEIGGYICPCSRHATSKNGKYLAKVHHHRNDKSVAGIGFEPESILTLVIYERSDREWVQVHEYDFEVLFSYLKLSKNPSEWGGAVSLDCNDYGEVFILFPNSMESQVLLHNNDSAWGGEIAYTFKDKNAEHPVLSKTWSPFVLFMFKKVDGSYTISNFSVEPEHNYLNTKTPVIGDEVVTFTGGFIGTMKPIPLERYGSNILADIEYRIIDNIPVVVVATKSPYYIDVYSRNDADTGNCWRAKNNSGGSWRQSVLLYTKIQVGDPILDVPVYEQDPIPIPPVPVYGTSAIEARRGSSVGLTSEYKVLGAGYNGSGGLNVSTWTDIIGIAAGTLHSVGLKKDGTVVATGDNEQTQLNVSTWTDVKKIVADWYHTVALKNDGTVVATGLDTYGQLAVSTWTDIVDICTSKCYTMGIKSDGTLVGCGEMSFDRLGTTKYPGAKKITVGTNHAVILTSNNTVVCLGSNYSEQSSFSGEMDIIDIAATEDMTILVKADGTLKYKGYNNGFNYSNLTTWTGIVKVAAGLGNVLGLKADGTVVQLGTTENGQGNVAGWDLNPEI